MQSNAMTKCAVGAMLFGGTLGVAHAGVTGIPPSSQTPDATLSLAYDYSAYEGVGVSGNPLSGPLSASDPTVGSITLSQFTGSGFSLIINSTAAANQQSFFVQQNFLVTEAVNFSLTGYLPFSGRALISQGTGLDTVFFADSGSNTVFNLTGTLQTGTYRFAYFSGAIGPQNGTLFNLSFTAVPAPGAIALLGAAGLVGSRRRKA